MVQREMDAPCMKRHSLMRQNSVSAAATTAATGLPPDFNPPDIRPGFEIAPTEKVGVAAINLHMQRLRIMVAGHMQRIAGSQIAQQAKDDRVTLAGRKQTNIDFLNGGSIHVRAS